MSKDEFREAVNSYATTILWSSDLDGYSVVACHLCYAASGGWVGIVLQHTDIGTFVLDLKPSGAR